MILVYTPCKNKQEARKIAVALLRKRLIACANMYNSESLYFWNKRLQNPKEVVIIAKTLEKHYKEIEETVVKLHSYDCPCILKLDTEGNEKFVKWVERGVR